MSNQKSILMPERHLNIVSVVLGLWEEKSEELKDQGLEYTEVLCRLNEQNIASKFWTFWRDSDGNLHSDEVKEDLEYLHGRGYIFCDGVYSVIPTQRAFNIEKYY